MLFSFFTLKSWQLSDSYFFLPDGVLDHDLGEEFRVHKKRQPLLSTGWRKDFIEPLIQDILSGRLVAHVTDPTSDQPLSFEPHSAINPNDD